MLFREWKPVAGQVIAEREKLNWRKWHATRPIAPMEYVVEYRLDDGSPQRTKVVQRLGKMITPRVGDTVPLLVDRKSGKVKWDISNPTLNLNAMRKAREAAENADFEAELED